MYLRGLRGVITIVYPDGTKRQASSMADDAWLHPALTAGAFALSSSGRSYSFQEFMGGVLLDGCPLNVIFGQGWLPGQIEALKNAGISPTCPENQIPAAQLPPTLQQIPAPGYVNPGVTPSGTRILPTGVATPSAPLIITTPGGTYYEPAKPAETGPATAEAGMSPLLMLGLGLGVLYAISRKKG